MKISKSFESVWDAIEDDPNVATNLRLRSTLMIALRDQIERSGVTQREAAAALGVTQPRVSDLLRGRIELFGLDALVNMATAAGLKVEIGLRNMPNSRLKAANGATANSMEESRRIGPARFTTTTALFKHLDGKVERKRRRGVTKQEP